MNTGESTSPWLVMFEFRKALIAEGLGAMSTNKVIAMHTNSGERGFTLLEILISISIFAIGVLAVATMQISAIRGNRLGNEVTQATFLVEDKLEELKNSADIASESDDSDQQGIFTRTWQISPATGDSQLVTVTVAWAIGGANHNVALSTITSGDGH